MRKLFWLGCGAITLGVLGSSPPAHGQEAKPPFRLNLQVTYTGLDEHPEMMTVISKSLRALPGVAIVDKDPDALVVINEARRQHQCACSVVVLVPERPSVRARIEQAVHAYDLVQESQTREGTGANVDSDKSGDFFRQILKSNLDFEPDGYHYKGSCVTIDPSPKVAVELAIKNLDEGFVERERKRHEEEPVEPSPAPSPPSQSGNPVPGRRTPAEDGPKVPGL